MTELLCVIPGNERDIQLFIKNYIYVFRWSLLHKCNAVPSPLAYTSLINLTYVLIKYDSGKILHPDISATLMSY